MTPHRIRSGLLALLAVIALCLPGQIPAAAGTARDGFGKVGPANGAAGQSLTPTLSWGSAAGATQYTYCIDTSNDNACAGNWISTGTSTSAVLHGLLPNTSYYWQVEANVGGSWVRADSGTWWSFTTATWSKLNPTSGSTGVPLNQTLSWQPAPGSDSYTYAYCLDTTNDNTCAGNWMSAGTNTSANPAGLLPSTQYYWQVYYSDSGYGTRYADGGTWWTFTTGAPPYGKVAPANGAAGQSLTPTLSWGSAAGATQYTYCIDTSNDNACAGNWISTGTSTSAVLHGLLPNTSYYWQVEANVGGSWVQADSGTWWSFTTATWSKLNPTSGSTGVPLNQTLSWQPAPGSDSYTYAYCLDTTNDNTCAGNWMSAGTNTSANPAGLLPSTQYYWQVYYSDSGYGTRYADGGTWWTFTTGASLVPNDDFGAATVIGGAPYTNTQDVAAATTAADDPIFTCEPAHQRSRSVWYRYTPPGAQTVTVDTIGSDYDTVLGVWTGSRGSLTSVACNDDYDDSGVRQSRVEFTPTAGTTYYIEVAAYADAPTTSQLTLNLAAAGPVPVTATFKSVAANDGWVLESSETSGVGGTLDSAATTCRVGDDAADRQYRAILDFNTGSLPNDAVITGVALRIK